MPIFSLLASACTSTRTWSTAAAQAREHGVDLRGRPRRPAFMKRFPTATRPRSYAVALEMHDPCPGWEARKFDGRRMSLRVEIGIRFAVGGGVVAEA